MSIGVGQFIQPFHWHESFQVRSYLFTTDLPSVAPNKYTIEIPFRFQANLECHGCHLSNMLWIKITLWLMMDLHLIVAASMTTLFIIYMSSYSLHDTMLVHDKWSVLSCNVLCGKGCMVLLRAFSYDTMTHTCLPSVITLAVGERYLVLMRDQPDRL